MSAVTDVLMPGSTLDANSGMLQRSSQHSVADVAIPSENVWQLTPAATAESFRRIVRVLKSDQYLIFKVA